MGTGFVVRETIERPLEVVWERLIDWEQAWQWMPGVDTIRVASGGPLRRGSLLAFRAQGRERHSTIVDWEPGERVALESRQGGLTAVYRYACAAEGHTTRVELQARCNAGQGLWRWAQPVVGYLMRRADSGQLQALKRLVEQRCP